MNVSPLTRLGAALLFASVINCASQPDPVPPADILIANARIWDGTGATIGNGSVLITGRRITSVTPGASSIAAAVEIDASGMTVLPGLIDTHRHLLATLMMDARFASSPGPALENWLENDLAGALIAYLEAGFTSILSNGDFVPEILDVRQRLADGVLVGPRLLTAGPVFTVPGGHPATTICGSDPWCRDRLAVEVDNAATARTKVRELREAGIDVVKVVNDGDLGVSMGPKLDDAVLAAILDEAAELGLLSMVHANGVDDMLQAVRLGVRRLVHAPTRASVRGVTEPLLEAAVMVATTASTHAAVIDDSGVARTPYGRPYAPRNRALLEQRLSNVRQLWDDGVLVAYGTDLPWGPRESLELETRTLGAVLSSVEILQALTRNAALYLDMGAELGTLAAGKIADILVVDGDPVADISALANVRFVIEDGEIVVDNR